MKKEKDTTIPEAVKEESAEGKKALKAGRRKKHFRVLLILLLVFLISWVISWIPVTERISLDLLPTEDKNVRLLLLTDLHSCWYGKGQKELLDMIDKAEPDLVLIGGDFFDDVKDDGNAKTVAEYVAARYTCFYVTGNHEYWSGRVDEMKAYMESIGVSVLAGDCKTVEIRGCMLDICGVDDPTRIGNTKWTEQLDRAYSQTDASHLRILLTHRPERGSFYKNYDYDLILAGHAHAGQIRIPFLNKGLYSPNQGFFAEYISGVYELENGSLLEVSRGLARETTPLPRFFNNPEIVVIDIH